MYSQKSTSTTLPRKSLDLNGLWLKHSAQVKSGAGAPNPLDSGAHRLPRPPITMTAMASTAAAARNRRGQKVRLDRSIIE